MSQRKTYQAPEIVDLGNAARLTLGKLIGCKPDGHCCSKEGTVEET